MQANTALYRELGEQVASDTIFIVSLRSCATARAAYGPRLDYFGAQGRFRWLGRNFGDWSSM